MNRELPSRAFLEAEDPGFKLEYQGSPQVFDALHARKKELGLGQIESDICPAMVLTGGSVRGVLEAGVIKALQEKGMTEVFSDVVAVSAGASIGTYFVSGNADEIFQICTDDIVRGNFAKLYRPWRILDMKSLRRIFDNRPIDRKRIKNSLTRLWIGVTEKDTARSEFINAQSVDDPIDLVMASSAAPILSGIPEGASTTINGKQYIDGAITNPLPVMDALEGVGGSPPPTHLLVVLTSPFGDVKARGKDQWKSLSRHPKIASMLGVSPEVAYAIDTYKGKYNETLSSLKTKMEEDGPPFIAVISPPVLTIGSFTRDPGKLLVAGNQMYKMMNDLLATQD